MPDAKSMFEYLGGVSFPLSASELGTDRSFPDPVKSTLLALFEAAFTYEMGGVSGVDSDSPWVLAISGIDSLKNKPPIADRYPNLPEPELLQSRNTVFPCLFLDRLGSGEFSGDGLEQEMVTCQWNLTYCLGPLRAEEFQRFNALLKSWFPFQVRLLCRNRFHNAYNGGNIPFGNGGVPLGHIKATSFSAGGTPVGDDKTIYYGTTVVLETIEYSGFVEHDGQVGDAVDFLGAKHHVRIGGLEGFVEGILDIDTAYPAPTEDPE